MDVILFGRLIDLRAEHFMNANTPMDVILLGRMTVSHKLNSPPSLLHARSPIEVKVLETVMGFHHRTGDV